MKLVGTRSNRDAFGARIEVKSGDLTQSLEVRSSSSFESASDPRVHFGLGSATHVDSIVVHWPSHQVDKLGPTAADREAMIRER